MLMRSEWDTQSLQEDFEVLGFAYYLCVVKRKSDGKSGTLDFHTVEDDGKYVRKYFNFQEA